MLLKTRKAFTMIELTYAIVIIGILSAVALPKLAATRDDAIISKARVTVSSLRNAISTERQLRVLRGDFTPITSLDGGAGNGSNSPIFDFFDGDNNNSRVLEYPMRSCLDNTARGCWIRSGASINGNYIYRFPHNNKNIVFNSSGSRFDCTLTGTTTQADCDLLVK